MRHHSRPAVRPPLAAALTLSLALAAAGCKNGEDKGGVGGSGGGAGAGGVGGAPAGSGGSGGVAGSAGTGGGGGAGAAGAAGTAGAGGSTPRDAAPARDGTAAEVRPASDAPAGGDGAAAAAAVIDTHTHFYDPTRPMPAGRTRPIPWPSPDSSLYKKTLPEDYRKLAAPVGITGTVVVEASGWLEDNDWILDLAAKDKVIVGLVGNLGEVWNDAAKFDEALAKYTRNPLFRGVRVGGGPVRATAPLDNFRKLAAADMAVDVLGAPWSDIARVAAEVPTLRIVIDHMGPGFKPATPADPAWVAGVQMVARHRNVYMKVSGLVEATGVRGGTAPADVEHYRASLDVVWAAFGEDRLIYGTNWPVSEPAAPLATVHDIVKKYFAAKGRTAEAKFFAGNARAAYKWVTR